MPLKSAKVEVSDIVGEFDFRAQNITKLCSETRPLFEFAKNEPCAAGAPLRIKLILPYP